MACLADELWRGGNPGQWSKHGDSTRCPPIDAMDRCAIADDQRQSLLGRRGRGHRRLARFEQERPRPLLVVGLPGHVRRRRRRLGTGERYCRWRGRRAAGGCHRARQQQQQQVWPWPRCGLLHAWLRWWQGLRPAGVRWHGSGSPAPPLPQRRQHAGPIRCHQRDHHARPSRHRTWRRTRRRRPGDRWRCGSRQAPGPFRVMPKK